jgi:hypothetical protein
MDNKEQIKELGAIVYSGLKLYTATHNEIFSESSTFRSVVKNVFGIGVPMSVLREDAEKLIPLWQGIQSAISDFKRTTFKNLTVDEKMYVDLLCKYADAVENTVKILVEQQILADDASKNLRKSLFSLKALKKIAKKHTSAVNEYVDLGSRLMELEFIIY